MPTYRNCACAICYAPLSRPQNTCGGRDCMDAWKHLNSAARLKHKNLAGMTPSERAFCLTQGPSSDEVEAAAQQRAILDAEVDEYQQQQQKKADSGFLPKSLRDALIANAPIARKEDTDETNELPTPEGETS